LLARSAWNINVRKGSHSAKDRKQLEQCILDGIGANDMHCIEAEDVDVRIKD